MTIRPLFPEPQTSEMSTPSSRANLRTEGLAWALVLAAFAAGSSAFGDGGGDLFPHLYGTLRLSAAQRRWTLETDDQGNPILPEEVR